MAAIDLAAFRTWGFQVLRAVLPPDVVSAVGAFAARAAAGATARLARRLHCEEKDLAEEVDGIVRRGELQRFGRDERLAMSGHLPLASRLSPELWAVPRVEALRAVLLEVFGGRRLRMHMPPTARFVLPANVHAGVPPHQDVSYNAHMSEFVTGWVPLTPIGELCGGVEIYRGSAARVRRDVGDATGLWLPGVELEPEWEPVSCDAAPGDVLLLDPWIVHRSLPNRSDGVRLSVDYRFFPAGVTSSKHCLDLDRWVVLEPASPSPAMRLP